MAIILYQLQKWIMPYGEKQKQGFVKMKESYKDFFCCCNWQHTCPCKVLHLQGHLENDSSSLLCLVRWSYASLKHIPLFPNFALTCFSLYFLL
jgi:hypothetical protein